MGRGNYEHVDPQFLTVAALPPPHHGVAGGGCSGGDDVEEDRRDGVALPQLRPDGAAVWDQDGRAVLCAGWDGEPVRHDLPAPGILCTTAEMCKNLAERIFFTNSPGLSSAQVTKCVETSMYA